MPFQPKIPLPQDGQPVAAGTFVPSLRALAGDVLYLKDVLDTELRGETVFIRDVTVDPAVQVGQPVYFNVTNRRFERAYANTVLDPVGGEILPADSGDAWGVVYTKTTATLATLLAQGYAPLDLSQAVTGPVTAGRYY